MELKYFQVTCKDYFISSLYRLMFAVYRETEKYTNISVLTLYKLFMKQEFMHDTHQPIKLS